MNTRKILFATIAAALLGLAAPQVASAQVTTTPPPYVMVSWGAINVISGQVVTLNLSLGDEGAEMKLPVQVELEDKNGNVVYQNTFTIATGHTVSLAIVSGDRTVVGPEFRSIIGADIYAIIGPEIRTLSPCLKIAYPPGPSQPILDQLTPTLQVLDALTGRVQAFGNNPHLTIVGATE